jgi:hypothetical protein
MIDKHGKRIEMQDGVEMQLTAGRKVTMWN